MPVFVDESSVPKELLCPVCKHPWDPSTARSCPQCEDIYCLSCVEELHSKGLLCVNGECKAPVVAEAFLGVHRTLRSLADAQVPVRCSNYVYGCDWRGVRSAAGAHEGACTRTKPMPHLYEDAVPEDLLCPICHEPFTEPVQPASCDHIFCTPCLTKALDMQSSSGENGTKKCPVCNAVGAEAEFQKVPKQIRLAVDNLKVKCIYASNGCTFVGPRHTYATHVRGCAKTTDSGVSTTTTSAVVATAPPAADPTWTFGPAAKDPKCKIIALNEFPSVAEQQDEPQTLVSMLHIDAPTIEKLEERKVGVTVSAVIDVSGSMQGSKLDLVKESLEFMVTQLRPEDSFGIITFATEVTEAFPLRRMDTGAKEDAERIIKAMCATSCTNLSGGLFAGLDQVCHIRSAPLAVPRPSPQRQSAAPGIKSKVGLKPPGSFFDALSSMFSSNAAPPVAQQQQQSISPVLQRASSPSSPPQQQQQQQQQQQAPAVSLQTASVVTVPAPAPNTSTMRPSDAAANAKTVSVVPTAVLLFTDGQANEGIKDRTALLEALKARLADGRSHVVVHTFGYGSDHDASLLQGIAEQSQGSYYFIKDQSVLRNSFADCLGGLVSVVCTQIHVDVSLVDSANCEVDQLMTLFPTTTNGNTYRILIKDMYSGESRDIPVRIRVKSTTSFHAAPATAIPLLEWKVGYHSCVDNNDHRDVLVATVPVAKEKYTGPANITVDEQCQRFLAIKALEEARIAAEAQDFARAQAALVQAKAAAATSASRETAYNQNLQGELECMSAAMSSPAAYAQQGEKMVHQAHMRHAQQRCNDASSAGMYQTAWKKGMK